MDTAQRVFKLNGVVQHYTWGGFHFLPGLLGRENREQKPFAEYWLGAHPNHSAELNGGSLVSFIQQQAPAVLGENVARKFSGLPYLLKILDVRQMLSIQVHPGKEAAALNFEEEDKKGIPLTAPHRNYKDRNHKPELMVALGDFWLLHGFKQPENLVFNLDATPELSFLRAGFEARGYRGLYEEVMMMDQQKVNATLAPLVERILPLYKDGALDKDEEDYWAARAAETYSNKGNYDRGIFSIYLFNLLHLQKGEGIYQPAGLPHAYLEGRNVEVMANSDNVLRAGLTDKHIDVAELMKHVDFVATIPRILSSAHKHKIYTSPAEEFELHQYDLKAEEEESFVTHSAETMVVLEGSVLLNGLTLKEGDAVLIVSGTTTSMRALAPGTVFRVTVPDN